MLLSLLYLLLVLATIYSSGYILQYLCNRFLNSNWKLSGDETILIGLMALSAITTYLSLVIPVSSTALPYLGVGLLISVVLINRSKFKKKLLINIKKNLNQASVLFILIFFLYLCVMAHEIWVFDSALHHAQAIQWIRKFKVVPGLANLQPQYGFNSSFFTISALFTIDLKNLIANHSVLIYPLNSVMCTTLAYRLMKESLSSKASTDSVFRWICVITLAQIVLIIPKWLSSPSPDIIVMILTIYAFIYTYKHFKNISSHNYFLLSLICATALSYKLSAMFIGLFMLIILIQKKYHLLFLPLIIFPLVLTPYLIRNVIMSGYLVFPIYYVDLFSFDWKVPLEGCKIDYDVIKAYARIPGKSMYQTLELSFTEWIPIWFAKIDLLYKILCIASIGVIARSIQLLTRKKTKLFFIYTVLLFNLVFWFVNAPSPRFVFAILFISSALLFSDFKNQFWTKKFNESYWKIAVLSIFLFISTYYHRGAFINIINNPSTILIPHSFSNDDLETVRTNFEYSYAKHPNQCKNQDLPCTSRISYSKGTLMLRKDNLNSGFRIEVPPK